MNRETEIDMYGRMAIALEMIENCHEFKYLVPEVRSNLVFRSQIESRNDVLAIDGASRLLTTCLTLLESQNLDHLVIWPD